MLSVNRALPPAPPPAGADLSNLLNEAAILTGRRNKEGISQREIDDSIDRIVAGALRTLGHAVPAVPCKDDSGARWGMLCHAMMTQAYRRTAGRLVCSQASGLHASTTPLTAAYPVPRLVTLVTLIAAYLPCAHCYRPTCRHGGHSHD